MMIISQLTQYSFLNFALITEIGDRILVVTVKSFPGIILATDKLISGNEMFPDKLKNLHHYYYRVSVCSQSPRVIIKNKVIRSPWIYFLIEIIKLQNASLDITLLADCKEILTLWQERKMDLSINTAVVFPADPNPKLLTYEEISYCAIVPFSPEVSFYHLTFIEPFDGLTWLFFGLSIACCFAVWWLFRRSGAVDSP